MELMTVKLALVVIGVIGLAVWQLYDVNRELRKDNEVDATAPAEAAESNIDEKRSRAADRPSESRGG